MAHIIKIDIPTPTMAAETLDEYRNQWNGVTTVKGPSRAKDVCIEVIIRASPEEAARLRASSTEREHADIIRRILE